MKRTIKRLALSALLASILVTTYGTYLCKRLDLPYRFVNKMPKTCKVTIITQQNKEYTFSIPARRTIEPRRICNIRAITIDGKTFTSCWCEGMKRTRKLAHNPFRTMSYQDHDIYGPILYAY